MFGAEQSSVTQILHQTAEISEQSGEKQEKVQVCVDNVGWKNLVEEFYSRAPTETCKIESTYRNNRRKKHNWSVV